MEIGIESLGHPEFGRLMSVVVIFFLVLLIKCIEFCWVYMYCVAVCSPKLSGREKIEVVGEGFTEGKKWFLS